MKFLASFFEETPGVGSMTRLVHWWAFVFCIALPLVVWALLSWRDRKLAPIDTTISTFCLGGFLTATGGKVAQSFAENKTPPAS